ncbi:MAG TPA: UDP-N-acetylmuramoyl-L-alanyl-D-glutamate--2,6-diaminopimelate ligase [Solirubrobacteraceae bacterium]|jgi:UDP-N-acetylmuramoyl-L-alanyl-D-glutamate--2,6-diaminopimelate ligase|nr:UDP-N-acetylmuramoyl-L-alanyl-D-glutamate--2,6-diaminopimelate ligase [Solirubrobacteraceae bacterium]
MKLGELIDSAPGDIGGTEVRSLAYDSRQVGPGALFFCVPGYASDGHDFAAAAVASGASALVVERPLRLGVPEVLVPSVRTAMASAAASFFGHPSRSLRIAGVTGTNGKTTTAFLIRSLLEGAGRSCGLLGTVKSVVGGVDREVARTTPEAIDLQASLREMLEAGDQYCAMEVSSHALELRRVDAIEFAVAVFTNLTQDHLDFHPSMEAYYRAKARLFEATAVSVVNVDDAYGRRLAGERLGAVTFAIDCPADFRAHDLAVDAHGCRFTLEARDRRVPLACPLPGRFNALNALGALAAGEALGLELEQMADTLGTVARVPGRFEPVLEGQDFTVLVDYAHTPDSLENVLQAARPLTDGRLVCVFGCGGDRDRSKRPLMGEIAQRLADVVIVTSDNPRSEVPEAIIEQILVGARGDHVLAVTDRREAIERAVDAAATGDVLVIAGKGHEQGQEFADGHKLPFDDVEVARAALRAAAPPRPRRG